MKCRAQASVSIDRPAMKFNSFLQSLRFRLPFPCFKPSCLLFTDDGPLLSVGELRQPGSLAVYLSVRWRACVCERKRVTGRQIAGHFCNMTF